MKKIERKMRPAALILALAMLFVLVSCRTGGESGQPTGTKPAQVTTGTAGGSNPSLTVETDAGNDPEPTGHLLTVIENGNSDFKIVNVGSKSEAIAGSAKRIQTMIYAATKVRLPIVEPMNVGENDRIIVTGTGGHFNAVTRVTREIGLGEYGYCLRGNILMVVGCTETTVETALSRFLSALTASAKGNSLYLEVGERGVFFNRYGWMGNVPRIEKVYQSVYECGKGAYMLYYRSATEDNCTELENLLVAHGDFTRTQGGVTESGNRTATYVREDGEVSYLWRNSDKVLQVFYQSYGDSVAPIPASGPETGYTKLNDTQLAILPLNYTEHKEEYDPTDCNGLSMVLTLEDGRFIVIDGGYRTDAHALYNYLNDHNRRADGITIAAWVLTHEHGDHIGAFEEFVPIYGARVTCEYLISNALPSGMTTTKDNGSSGVLLNLDSVARKFRTGTTKILQLHAGQSAWFCNTELRMLMTHEIYYPSVPDYLNETSLVFQLRTGGQTVLVTADCELGENDKLISIWGNELKADIYQVNHHGYSGVTSELLQLVDPDVALWPTSESTASVRRRNAWYRDLESRVDLCIVADGDAMILTLPYQTGATFEFYNMIFVKKESGI